MFEPLSEFQRQWYKEMIKSAAKEARLEVQAEEAEKRQAYNTRVLITLYCLFLLATIAPLVFLNSPAELIKARYAWLGYHNAELTIEKTGTKNIYKASLPVFTQSGKKVDLWEIKHTGGNSPGTFAHFFAEPCTDEPLQKVVTVNYYITEREFERLETGARLHDKDVGDMIISRVYTD